ncbi:(d)CMP kinase [Alicyclobacillus tolerans]|uniref:(d)CMP kinase n=1 Tax=Alicyclobacillus tolerans TaxID=90970 RepID=UPI001EFFAB20|nr:(d)CMP kinase [Alicyclobacillus tolerans]MCF8563721.1 (d)CMP kinase [Alicyclobacillus tolerans]
MDRITIAIDGPAGAGKSTVAKEVAKRLGISYIDTGAMYRGAAWLVVQHEVTASDEAAVVHLMDSHSLHFEARDHGGFEVFADGEPIAAQLRTPEVSDVVSQISALPKVRDLMTKWFREFSRRHSVVMDGRDIGTVVLPDATVKIFLTADLDERTRRRAEEFDKKGYDVSWSQLKSDIEQRDARDSSREVAPLRPAADAHYIDSTGRSVSEVVQDILNVVEQVSYD